MLPIGRDIRLLEQNLQHYLSLGVERVFLSVHAYGDKGEKVLRETSSRVKNKKYKTEIVDIHRGKDIEDGQRCRRIMRNNCQKEDWVIVADLDEFIQFPVPPFDIVNFCEKNRYDYITGRFLDRIGAEGNLPVLLPDQPVWDCFPIGVRLTREVAKGCDRKVTLTRAWIELDDGHHHAKQGRECPANECSSIVHHFKWDASSIDKCQYMKELHQSTGKPWGHEYQRILDFFGNTNGEVPLSLQSLGAFWPAYNRTSVEQYQGEPGLLSSDLNFLYPSLQKNTLLQYTEKEHGRKGCCTSNISSCKPTGRQLYIYVEDA
ncbi:MAG: hypothetical protein D3909_04820 [Candidatus Electrothrix sp. ATG1]|nr:hypothetical protein [Candidatus Electrothrix sp. ATG1]